jgi:hypothetical protein
MPIEISMSGQDAGEELASLYAWIRDDDGIRRHASMTFQAGEPGPGQMGSELAVIQLVVDSGFQALNFALAYAAWRASRRSRPGVTIHCNGTRAEIEDEPEAVEVIVRVLDAG